MKTKKQMREEMRKKRQELDVEQRIEWNRMIRNHVEKHELWRSAGTVLAYWSMDDEVDTHGLIEDALDSNKTVLLPRCKKARPDFDLVQITDPDRQLESGPFSGLMQPGQTLPVYIYPKDIELVLTPGLAFTADGYRLGMGGGMYDRFFAGHTASPRLALAYGFQVVDVVPHERHDERVDWVATEQGLMGEEPNRYQKLMEQYSNKPLQSEGS